MITRSSSKAPKIEKADEVASDSNFVGRDPIAHDLHDSNVPRLVVDDRMIPDANLPTEYVEGVLDIANEGSGLLRPNFASSDHDIYISASQIRKIGRAHV